MPLFRQRNRGILFVSAAGKRSRDAGDLVILRLDGGLERLI